MHEIIKQIIKNNFRLITCDKCKYAETKEYNSCGRYEECAMSYKNTISHFTISDYKAGEIADKIIEGITGDEAGKDKRQAEKTRYYAKQHYNGLNEYKGRLNDFKYAIKNKD
jgi:hypothetical protein